MKLVGQISFFPSVVAPLLFLVNQVNYVHEPINPVFLVVFVPCLFGQTSPQTAQILAVKRLRMSPTKVLPAAARGLCWLLASAGGIGCSLHMETDGN